MLEELATRQRARQEMQMGVGEGVGSLSMLPLMSGRLKNINKACRGNLLLPHLAS